MQKSIWLGRAAADAGARRTGSGGASDSRAHLANAGPAALGSLVVGLSAQALLALRDLVVREDVREAIRRFGLNLSKPADVTAAYAFLWAGDHGPWLFGTPQTGPAMLAMAERAIRAAQADPDLFGQAVADDETA